MVSNASELLPDPLTPVIATRRFRGRSRSMPFKLWTRTPRNCISRGAVIARASGGPGSVRVASTGPSYTAGITARNWPMRPLVFVQPLEPARAVAQLVHRRAHAVEHRQE